MREEGILPSTEEDWDKWINGDDDEWDANMVIPGDNGDQQTIEAAREAIIEGLDEEVGGKLKIVKALMKLRDGDLWRRDQLVSYLERPVWKDYLKELAAWIKEQDDRFQISVSTFYNYARYYRVFVEGMGLPEFKVFGATEKARRDALNMVHVPYGKSLPTALRNRYALEKLPQPPSFTGEETTEEKVQEGFRIVCEDIFSTPVYSQDTLANYHAGDGADRYKINAEIALNTKGTVVGVHVWVKKESAVGEPLESYKVNLLTDEMPLAVLDWLEEKGIRVVCPD